VYKAFLPLQMGRDLNDALAEIAAVMRACVLPVLPRKIYFTFTYSLEGFAGILIDL
jgi:hypothetical protein